VNSEPSFAPLQRDPVRAPAEVHVHPVVAVDALDRDRGEHPPGTPASSGTEITKVRLRRNASERIM
jgi:hypothetical protein